MQVILFNRLDLALRLLVRQTTIVKLELLCQLHVHKALNMQEALHNMKTAQMWQLDSTERAPQFLVLLQMVILRLKRVSTSQFQPAQEMLANQVNSALVVLQLTALQALVARMN